ncbi:hypothetical protein D3C77_461660 [compost metagenome]
MAGENKTKKSALQNECEAAAYFAVSGRNHSVICPERLWQLPGWANFEAACDERLHRAEQAKLQADQPGYRSDQQGELDRIPECAAAEIESGFEGGDGAGTGKKLRKPGESSGFLLPGQ